MDLTKRKPYGIVGMPILEIEINISYLFSSLFWHSSWWEINAAAQWQLTAMQQPIGPETSLLERTEMKEVTAIIIVI